MQRAETIKRLRILDTAPEQLFDDAARLASQICGTEVALISILDGHRLWFKAALGIKLKETPSQGSFCRTVVEKSKKLVVADACKDRRFVNNELASGPSDLRFYAGVPICVESIAVGTLCVLSSQPKQLTPAQLESLAALGRSISFALDQRLKCQDMQDKQDQIEAIAITAVDLTEKLRHASDRFSNLFHSLPIACITLDLQGNIMEWNAKSTEVYGYSSWEAFSKSIVDLLLPPESRAEGKRILQEQIAAGGKHHENREWRILRKDGEELCILSSMVPLFGPRGELVGLISTNVDITARKRSEAALRESNALVEEQKRQLLDANARLSELATTDGLTGLSNHRTYQEFLRNEFDRCQRTNRGLSLILLDIDNFKSHNDEFGHPAGDAILRRIGEILRDYCRSENLIARYGGEEFVVVLPGSPVEKAVEIASKIRAQIQKAHWPNRPVTASFGIATQTQSMTDPEEITQNADQALYQSKHQGRNCVSTFTPALLDVA